MLSGRPTLRVPEGERELEAGDVVSFLPGRRGAHRVDNRSDADCRVLMLSTKHPLEVAEYPDSGKTMVMHRPDDANPDDLRHMFRPGQSLDYFEGELPE